MPRHDDNSVHPNTPKLLETLQKGSQPHTSEEPRTRTKHTSRKELEALARQYGFQTVDELLERYPHLNPRKAKRK